MPELELVTKTERNILNYKEQKIFAFKLNLNLHVLGAPAFYFYIYFLTISSTVSDKTQLDLQMAPSCIHSYSLHYLACSFGNGVVDIWCKYLLLQTQS